MNFKYKGKKYEVFLGDDGTLDTIIVLSGITHRLDSEGIRRHKDCTPYKTDIIQACENIIESDPRYWDEYPTQSLHNITLNARDLTEAERSGPFMGAKDGDKIWSSDTDSFIYIRNPKSNEFHAYSYSGNSDYVWDNDRWELI